MDSEHDSAKKIEESQLNKSIANYWRVKYRDAESKIAYSHVSISKNDNKLPCYHF